MKTWARFLSSQRLWKEPSPHLQATQVSSIWMWLSSNQISKLSKGSNLFSNSWRCPSASRRPIPTNSTISWTNWSNNQIKKCIVVSHLFRSVSHTNLRTNTMHTPLIAILKRIIGLCKSSSKLERPMSGSSTLINNWDKREFIVQCRRWMCSWHSNRLKEFNLIMILGIGTRPTLINQKFCHFLCSWRRETSSTHSLPWTLESQTHLKRNWSLVCKQFVSILRNSDCLAPFRKLIPDRKPSPCSLTKKLKKAKFMILSWANAQSKNSVRPTQSCLWEANNSLEISRSKNNSAFKRE